VSATITAAVLAAGRPWPARPLASVSPLLSCEAFLVQSRQEGPVQTQAVSLAWGSTIDGEQARLGWWRSESEGATWWLAVFTELNKRGVPAGFRACVDGLHGRPEAIAPVLPHPQGPLGMVHKVRHRLREVPWRARRAVAAEPARDRWRHHPHGRGAGPGALCRPRGPQGPSQQPEWARRRGAVDGVLGRSPGDASRHLDDPRYGVVKLCAAEGTQRAQGMPA
jgi:hypothetical protein